MKIRIGCGIGYVGAVHEDEIEIDEAELSGMSPDEIDEYIQKEYVIPFVNERLEMWYEKIE